MSVDQSAPAQSGGQQDPYIVIRNLNSVIEELDAQNGWLRARSAENKARADRYLETAKSLEEQNTLLRKALDEANAKNVVVPSAPETEVSDIVAEIPARTRRKPAPVAT